MDTLIQNIPAVYPGVVLEHDVIMPSHVHLLLRMESEDSGGPGAARPTVQTIVGGIKSITTPRIGASIWQPSFYDHIVRNESDFLRIWTYIDTNPAEWAEDRYCSGEGAAL
ncbi:MAG: hypothetical protein Q4C45_02515 [Oscillospiraceae bacterium]|nr:hypothetical protein [Oscillospiraceae bacterium]